MNEAQFHLVADVVLRKPIQRKAAFDVFFRNLSAYYAERKHNCTPGSVKHSVAIITRHFDHCVAVSAAK